SGLLYVHSEPAAVVEGDNLVWTLGELPGGATRDLKAVFKSTRVGQVVSRSSVVTAEGLRDEKTAGTEGTPPPTPRLAVSLTAPPSLLLSRGDGAGSAETPVTYQVTVSNPGTAPAENVLLRAEFDRVLEHESKHNPVELPVGTVEA